jgi:hypothetical protein
VTALRGYRVRLVETGEAKTQFAFDCEAEDFRHALEQAAGAYPDGICVAIKERADVSAAGPGVSGEGVVR